MKRTVSDAELEAPLVPYGEAVSQVLAAFAPLPPRDVALSQALGLVISETVVAEHDVPGFDNSAMDGYAVRAADTSGASPDRPVFLRLAGDLPAGSKLGAALAPGTAVKIMTGAPVPPGADAVVPWEDTDRGERAVGVTAETASGKHVRPRGEDLGAGDEVIRAGETLRAVHLGVLASLGRGHAPAHPRPRVGVLSTGDELVAAGGKLREGQVYDSNSVLLTAMCTAAGAIVTATGTVGDDPAEVAAWLAATAPHADLLVTSGGASVGEHDWLREVLSRDGELALWRVAIKPGKPIAFGRVAGAPVLALPGNPGSAFVGVHVFVAPAIRLMAGKDPAPRARTSRLARAVRGSPARTLFCRVRLERDGEVAVPLPAQSSVVLSNLIPTEAFAVVPPGGLPEGAEVRVEYLET